MRTSVAATAGRIPRIGPIQFTPPTLRPNPNAELQMEATLIGPAEIQLPPSQWENYGDPRKNKLTNSAGPGGGGGFGKNCCGGVGKSRDPGFGEDGEAGIAIAGKRGYGTPVCTYCPNPSFSDEAVKAKYQGVVMLRVLVTADGKPARLSVLRGPGMGLDERALAAVSTWRFRPALGPDQKPAAVWVTIEVNFRQF